MSKVVVADDSLRADIDKLQKQEDHEIGLLIGQLSSGRHYVYTFIRTPDDTDDDDDEQPIIDDSKTKKKKTKNEKDTKVSQIKTMSDAWMALHAKQVLRMLPGGLDIIGIYAAASQPLMEKALTKLRQLIYAVYKVLRKNDLEMLPEEAFMTERVLLQICQTTRKTICKIFDGENWNESLRMAELKYQSLVPRLLTLHTRIAVDHTFYVAKDNNEKVDQFYKQMMKGLKHYSYNVWNAIGTVNGILHHTTEPLLQLQPSSEDTGKKRKGRRNEPAVLPDTNNHIFSVNLYFQQDVLPDTVPAVVDVTKRFYIKGTMQARAFVHSKCTVQDGLKALKSDIVRGLKARCELLYEDVLEAKEDDTSSTAMETPKRVFANIPRRNLTFCDYMFTDETPQDVVDRFREILNTDIEVDVLEIDKERYPDMAELESSEEDESPTIVSKTNTSTSRYIRGGVVVSGVVGILAMALSYFYIQQ